MVAMSPPSGPARRASYSLFQRSVRVVQTSIRAMDNWLLDRMPGLPNPPDQEAELRRPAFIDLWELTLADHRRHLADAWREYKATFDDVPDEEMERSKADLRAAALRLRGEVTDNAQKNLTYVESELEGTQVLANVREIASTATGNAAFLKEELEQARAKIDPDAIAANVRSVVEANRSQDDVVTTFTRNVGELADLVKEGRDAALELEAKDVENLKSDAQSWFMDKLIVAQSVLMAFIEGYREGKTLELEREDALLLTYARQAASEQKAVLKEQFDKFLAEQKAKKAAEDAAKAAAAEASPSTSSQGTRPTETARHRPREAPTDDPDPR